VSSSSSLSRRVVVVVVVSHIQGNSLWVRFVKMELKELNELDREWSVGKPERPPRSDDSCGVRTREEALGSY
jgi:hypothetical protein